MTGPNIISLFRERIARTVIPAPDQVEGDVKDTAYQTAYNKGIVNLSNTLKSYLHKKNLISKQDR
jgi:hypothetical protein